MADRFLPSVIDQMIVHIPDSEKSLKEDLLRVKNDASYTAPELMTRRWGQGSTVLETHFPDPKILNEWQQKIVNIWMDKDAKLLNEGQ